MVKKGDFYLLHVKFDRKKKSKKISSPKNIKHSIFSRDMLWPNTLRPYPDCAKKKDL